MNNEQLDLASIYGIPSCAGGDCSPGAVFFQQSFPVYPGDRISTLEEIAGYNIQNPENRLHRFRKFSPHRDKAFP